VSLVVDEHRQYLADPVRISAFRRAIGRVVQPGHVVVDLGAGTGILGLLACQAGAARVYAIDDGGVIELAREICRANGFDDRVVFLKGLSTRLDLPEKADVVLADQIGRFGFDAGLLEYFSDARGRFLKADGVTVPAGLELVVAPVEHGALREQVEFWNSAPAGLDFRPARALAANTGYPVSLGPEHLLGEPAALASLDLAAAGPGPLALDGSIDVTRAGRLDGVGGWFSARLSPGVVMTNSPRAAERIRRANVVFPIDRPVTLEPGDRVRIRMRILPADLVVSWTVEVWADAVRKGAFAHSTLRGMLLAREDLDRMRPHFVPRLSPWGEARRSVLGLCDGRRALSEIERELFARHPDLFGSLGEAAGFVAEVVTRYSV
jgi:ribosomal protein L11 methyltransferase PrmA/PRMT5 arginine-N-methyltransferase